MSKPQAISVAPGSTLPASSARNPTKRPVYKLSVDLIDTYKQINKIYYEQKAKRKSTKETGKGERTV